MSLSPAKIKSLKVADLRKQLTQRKVDYAGLTRKAQLVAKLTSVIKAEEEEAAAAEAEAQAEEVVEEAEVAEEVAEEAEVAEEVEAEAEAEVEVEVEVEAEAEVEVEAEPEAAAEEPAAMEEVSTFVVEGPPSGPNAQDAILNKLDAKDEGDLTSVEKDIVAARARNDKFTSDGADVVTFKISDELKRKLRAERFGPITVFDNRRKNKKAKISEDVDESERKRRDARALRFTSGLKPAEEVATEEVAEEATEEVAVEEVPTEEVAVEEVATEEVATEE